MNNEIARKLNQIADGMPILFKWVEVPEVFTGKELNLTPLGEFERFDPAASYTVLMPAQKATEHRQQIKDAYKRGGMEAVKVYHSNFMAQLKAPGVKVDANFELHKKYTA